MEKAGVPWCRLSRRQPGRQVSRRRGEESGYPLLVKAVAAAAQGHAAGDEHAEFAEQLASARRRHERLRDEAVLLERFVRAAPHRFQVRRTHGHYVHLFERECSIQRRHQKCSRNALAVPRRAMPGDGEAQSRRRVPRLSRAGPSNSSSRRPQVLLHGDEHAPAVEHPVTEMTTGKTWSNGSCGGRGRGTSAQAVEILAGGHAIEVRAVRQTPPTTSCPRPCASRSCTRPWIPPGGRRERLRLDTGVRRRRGDVFYDPLSPSCRLWDDRREAARRMQRALATLRSWGSDQPRFLERWSATRLPRGETDTDSRAPPRRPGAVAIRVPLGALVAAAARISWTSAARCRGAPIALERHRGWRSTARVAADGVPLPSGPETVRIVVDAVMHRAMRWSRWRGARTACGATPEAIASDRPRRGTYFADVVRWGDRLSAVTPRAAMSCAWSPLPLRPVDAAPDAR